MKRSFEEFVGTATTTTKTTALDSAIVNKPVFLTKAHREELALKRRQDEIANQRRQLVQITRSNLETDNRDGNRNRCRDIDQARDRDRDREREEEVKAKAERLAKLEINAMKEQYIGSTKPKKRVIKPSEKFRFSFDWENSEDTWREDTNLLYQNPHEAQLLFGRGFRAGIDRREQKKQRPEDKHWSEKKKFEEMAERDWRIFKEDFNISYRGSKIPPPVRNWGESKLSPELLKAVEKAGYKKPRPIQMAAIPLGLQQRDVIGIAETGTGKTAAFLLPMLAYISKLPKMSQENTTEGPYALVLAPTRELARQIEEETVTLARYLDLKVTSIVGGRESVEEQGFTLSKGCEIVIATPGRLLDLLERRLQQYWKLCLRVI